MRFSVLKYEEDKTAHYNPGIFLKNEDVILFPFQEFDNFYNELVQNLNVVKRLIDDALNSESTTNPTLDLEHIKDWMEVINADVDLLIQFKMQTILPSFQVGNSARIKPPLKTPRFENKAFLPQKEEIQCLIGL